MIKHFQEKWEPVFRPKMRKTNSLQQFPDSTNRGIAVTSKVMIAAAAFVACLSPAGLCAQGVGHITGLGGIFVTSKNPKALAQWYKDVLGIPLEPWGGAILRYDAPGHPPLAVWNAMSESSAEIAPSRRDFVINFAVDDLDAFSARLEAKGIKILKREDDATGKFAWILDPDGTKIELWQPLGK